jgi:hypothetical protein
VISFWKGLSVDMVIEDMLKSVPRWFQAPDLDLAIFTRRYRFYWQKRVVDI